MIQEVIRVAVVITLSPIGWLVGLAIARTAYYRLTGKADPMYVSDHPACRNKDLTYRTFK